MFVKFLAPFDGKKVDYRQVQPGDVLDLPDATVAYLVTHDIVEVLGTEEAPPEPEPKPKGRRKSEA